MDWQIFVKKGWFVMSYKKSIYMGFVSSTGELTNYRASALEALLEHNVLPVLMERFTVAIDGIREIEEFIDDSDFFILILGEKYGSREPDGERLSWTHKEFKYAEKNNKKIVAFILPKLKKLLDNNIDKMTDEEIEEKVNCQSAEDTKDQIAFARKLSEHMLQNVRSPQDLRNKLTAFISANRNNVDGWQKRLSIPQIKFGKNYYHVHLREGVDNYMRIGTVKFSRIDTNSVSMNGIHATATNFKVIGYDYEGDGEFFTAQNAYTIWTADYYINEGSLVGIYKAKKHDAERFGDLNLASGERTGIHIFNIASEVKEGACILWGTFQDSVPTSLQNNIAKSGDILIFNSEEERKMYILKNYKDILDSINSES